MRAVHPLNIVWTPLSAGRTFPLALALRSDPGLSRIRAPNDQAYAYCSRAMQAGHRLD